MTQAFKLSDQTTLLPNNEDIEIAAESSRLLAALIGKGEKAQIRAKWTTQIHNEWSRNVTRRLPVSYICRKSYS